jgi:hypothetical protein
MNDMNLHSEVRRYRLQSATWPRGDAVGIPEELCFRASPRSSWRFDPAGSIKALPTGYGVLELSTFFGAFSLTTWCGSAGIDEVTLEAKFVGTCTLKIYEDNGYHGRSLLWEKRVSSVGTPYGVALKGLKQHRGILFPVFEVYQGDELELFNVGFFTKTAPKFSPRLAIVMPTYKREAYARRNIDLISTEVLRTAGDACRLFVIDNGHSLDLPPISGVELIRNRNFGGSGGFARGVLAASNSQPDFSPVLRRRCADRSAIHQSTTDSTGLHDA